MPGAPASFKEVGSLASTQRSKCVASMRPVREPGQIALQRSAGRIAVALFARTEGAQEQRFGADPSRLVAEGLVFSPRCAELMSFAKDVRAQQTDLVAVCG